MTIRTKIFLTIILTLVGLLLILFAVLSQIFSDSFSNLEQSDTKENVTKTLEALSDELDGLELILQDWSEWDDSYYFMQNHNKEYVSSNLSEPTFINLKLNLLLYINKAGEIIFGNSYDLQHKATTPIPEAIRPLLTPDNLLLQTDKSSSRHLKGFLLLSERPFLLVDGSILLNGAKGPSVGSLIMGRELDASTISQLSRRVGANITFYPVDTTKIAAETRQALLEPKSEKPIIVTPLNEDKIAGYTLLRDIYGKPIFILQAENARNIYKQGKDHSLLLFTSVFVVVILLGIVMMLLLEWIILKRLTRLRKEVYQIGLEGNLFVRVSVRGRDDLSIFAKILNQTLEALEKKAQQKVVLQLSENISKQLVDVTDSLTLVTKHQASGATDQASSIIQVSNSVQELSEMTEKIFVNASQITQAIDRTVKIALIAEENALAAAPRVERGQEVSQRVLETIHTIQTNYELLNEQLVGLSQNSEQINKIIGLIGEVASQTHLLALNASIESVSAGVYGNRFAAVAREIKLLANRVHQSASEIARMIGQTRTGISRANHTFQEGMQASLKVINLTQEAGELIKELSLSVEQAAYDTKQVAQAAALNLRLAEEIQSATQQQSGVFRLVVYNMSGVNKIASETLDNAVQISGGIETINELTTSLQHTLVS
jgi:sensor domain CHASE-containing protein